MRDLVKAMDLLSTKGLYRFENFELDTAGRRVLRSGERVTLPPKAFDVLWFLILNAGRLVTKEELMAAVWSESYVEEGNLAQQIRHVRRALDDRAELIVTIPGKGYQFTAQVAAITSEAAILGPAALPNGSVVIEHVRERSRFIIEETTRTMPPPANHRTKWIAVGSVAAILLAAPASYLAWRHLAYHPQLRKVILASFQNRTGESIFDDSLQSGLRIDLEQSPYIDLPGRDQIADTLASMEKPVDTPLTGDVAREVCVRTNSHVLLEGGISRVGSEFLLTLEATNCSNGKTVDAEKKQVSDREQVLNALDQLTRKMRWELGESHEQVGEFEVPIAEATTSSLEALRDYSLALASSDRGDTVTERALLNHAIGIDPNFASAYEQLGVSDFTRLDFVQGAENMQKAYDLRAHTTERERLSIEITYDDMVLNDWEALIISMKLYSQIYPDDSENWYRMAHTYSSLGLYPEAIAAGEQGYRLAPHSGSGADILSRIYRRAGQFADAKRVAEAAIHEGKDRWSIHRTLYGIAFIEQDLPAMEAQSKWGQTNHEGGQLLIEQGFVAASEGKVREARNYFVSAREKALAAGDFDFADDASLFLAGILMEYGYPTEAKACLQLIRNEGEDPGTIASFKALLGDAAFAKRLIAQYSNPKDKSSLHRYFDLPELSAQLARMAGKPEEAITDLEPSRKYQWRDYGIAFERARSEADAGLLDEAATDYRLIMAHAGIEPTWPDRTTSRLYLARVLARQHKMDEAKQEYQTFLNAWKDGDPDLPLLQQARDEYARLTSSSRTP